MQDFLRRQAPRLRLEHAVQVSGLFEALRSHADFDCPGRDGYLRLLRVNCAPRFKAHCNGKGSAFSTLRIPRIDAVFNVSFDLGGYCRRAYFLDLTVP